MSALEKGQEWSLKMRCTGNGNGDQGCENLLIIEEKDICVTFYNDYSGKMDYCFTICCPNCGVETDIPGEDIPYNIRNRVFNEFKEKYKRIRGRGI